jgi:hypothetical protein
LGLIPHRAFESHCLRRAPLAQRIEHQTTDLAVGGSNPSRRAPNLLVSALGLGLRVLSGRRTATKLRPRWRALPTGLRPPATTCDHHGPYGPHCCWSARPWRRHRWIGCGCCPFPTSMSGQCTGMHGHGRSAGWSPVMASVHHGMPVSRRVAKTPVRVELGASGPWEGWVAGSIPAGGSTSKGNRRAWGMGASARHRGLIRGHGRSVTGDTGNLKGSNVRSIVVAAHPRPSLTTGGLPPPQPSLLRSTRTPIVGILDKRSVSARSRQP